MVIDQKPETFTVSYPKLFLRPSTGLKKQTVEGQKHDVVLYEPFEYTLEQII